MQEATQVKMPKVDVIWREKYDLDDLSNELVLPVFQRRKDVTHANKIAQAIMENKFYDNVITVYKENGKMYIIDGQHRIAALQTCRNLYKLRWYSLVFIVFPKEMANTVFRRNNLGKKLQIADMIKSMTDVNPEFFKRMRKYVDEYRNQARVGYGDLFAAFVYAIGDKKENGVTLIEDFLPQIKIEHIDALERMMDILSKLEKHPNKNPIYRMACFRNLYKLTFDLKLSQRQISRIISYVRSSPILMELTDDRKQSGITTFYQKLIDAKSKWF